MKKKKPLFSADPTHQVRIASGSKNLPGKEWHASLLVWLKSLSRRDTVILSVVAFLLLLLVWRPTFNAEIITIMLGFMLFVAVAYVALTGIVAQYNQRVETEIVTRWAVNDEASPKKAKQLKWITTAGGPLIMLSQSLLPYWEGADMPSNGRVVEANFRWQGVGMQATDYDSACDVQGYLGLLDVGEGHGLILGEEPMPTAWWPADRGQSGGILVRRNSASEDGNLIREISDLPEHLWVPTGLVLNVGKGPLYLFDSAYPGTDLKDHIEIRLAAGPYSILTCEYSPAKDSFLVLHCFIRQ